MFEEEGPHLLAGNRGHPLKLSISLPLQWVSMISALVEMRMMLALICYQFRLGWAPGCARPGVSPQITAAPDAPVWLRLEPR
jgi:hypothetical protein